MRPRGESFIEGCGLVRTCVSEAESRFASDSLEDICYDGKTAN